MVLTNGKTDIFQKPKGEDPEAVSEERILSLSKDWAGQLGAGGRVEKAKFQAAPIPLPGGDPSFGSRRLTGQECLPCASDPWALRNQPQLCYGEVHSANR